MPPIAIHMVVAREVAEDLGTELLASRPGPYVLGAASPDIRVLTREPRIRTHFFDLEVMEHQDSVAAFFEAFGKLAEPENLNEETAAWVAGYISHLVMDELYITEIYRPVFLKHDLLGGKLRANLMDRLLQFDVEARYSNDQEVNDGLVEALACTVEGIETGFIEPETLDRWRGVCTEIAARQMDWEIVRRMIANHLQRSGIETGPELDRFLDDLPALRDETSVHVPDDDVRGFLERSRESVRTTIARYVGCE